MTALTPMIPTVAFENLVKCTILSIVTLQVQYFQNGNIDTVENVFLEIEEDGVEYSLNVSKYLLDYPEIQDRIQSIVSNEIEDDDDEDGKWYRSSETVEEKMELEFEAFVDKINKEVYLKRFEGTEARYLEVTEYLSKDETDELF